MFCCTITQHYNFDLILQADDEVVWMIVGTVTNLSVQSVNLSHVIELACDYRRKFIKFGSCPPKKVVTTEELTRSDHHGS